MIVNYVATHNPDDFISGNEPFELSIHGQFPDGQDFSDAVRELIREGYKLFLADGGE